MCCLDEVSNQPHCNEDKAKATLQLLPSNINKDDHSIARTNHHDPNFIGPFLYLLITKLP
ncbi:hypothetical protein PGTUg99_033057 [Puccinia graminis f. sp. tritici]|uniref:Uncharacterized protein n=1 Tax=Puccinia graminis f. sp. tritici TaxID=56615 RepID=A0A5B0PPU6_PUCGR|nr:hypothetical protein PGTUg99_033057 [Puccinia graminis f. sp. tritici]